MASARDNGLKPLSDIELFVSETVKLVWLRRETFLNAKFKNARSAIVKYGRALSEWSGQLLRSFWFSTLLASSGVVLLPRHKKELRMEL